MQLKEYLNSPDINLNLYSIYIIKQFLIKNNFDEKSIKTLIEQLNDEILLLLSSLLNKNNNNLASEILIILINISYPLEGEMLFGNEEKVISNIANFLGNNKTNINLLYYGILLIKNITNKNSLVKQILQNYNIIQFFNEIYENYLLDVNFINCIILCIGHFINSRFDNNRNILSSIKIIKTQLVKNMPVRNLVESVYILYNLSLSNNIKTYEAMVKYEVEKNLMDIYPFENDIKIKELNEENNSLINIDEKNVTENDYQNLRLLILKILAKIMSSENNDEITQKVIDSGIAKFLNKVLQTNNIKIIKNVFFCASNICAGTYGQISNLYDNGTIFELIKSAKIVYDSLENNNFINSTIRTDYIKTFKEINYVISLTIMNSLYERLIPIAKYKNYAIILILLKGLKFFDDFNASNNTTLLIFILNALSKLIDYDNTEDEDEPQMFAGVNFREFLSHHAFKEILEKLQTNGNEKIVDLAEQVFDKLYDDDDSDNNINIDDIVNGKNNDNDNDNDERIDDDY